MIAYHFVSLTKNIQDKISCDGVKRSGSNTSLKSNDNENALELALKHNQLGVVKFLKSCTATDQQKKNQRRMSTPTGLPIFQGKNNNQRRMSVHPNLNAAQKKNNNNQRRMSIL